jgi:hypothetical protein
MASQIRITGLNAGGGVYQLRLNFNGSTKWDGDLTTLGGTFLRTQWDYAVVSIDTIKSSRPTAALESESGDLSIELNDAPNLAYYDDTDTEFLGPIFREHFEGARTAFSKVHAILAFYDDVTAAPTRFCFAGSMDPSTYSVAHRRIPLNGDRRSETISCDFSPGERFNVALENVQWVEADTLPEYEFIAGLTPEPETTVLTSNGSGPQQLSAAIRDGITLSVGHIPVTLIPTGITHIVAYGCNAPSNSNAMNPNPVNDPVGVGRTFPAGNRGIRMSTAVSRICDTVGVAWAGTLNRSVDFRSSEYDNVGNAYVDFGTVTDPILHFNYTFGFNPYDGTNFQSPGTYDSKQTALDVLRGFAAQLGCWISLTDTYDANGQPYMRFMPVDEEGSAMAALTELPDSSEDAPISDSDGVKVSRRGFDGAIIAPANALNPVEIIIPFSTHAMGYESDPCYDVSRLTFNSALEFKSQWKCGQRGALSSDGLDGGQVSLNPDGWVLGTLLYEFDGQSSISHFPSSLDTSGHHDDAETAYQSNGWQQYYALHATYESPLLTDDEKRLRQEHPLLTYAMLFGQAIRGQRRQLVRRFQGANWDVALGQTYSFTPVTDPVTYRVAGMERNVIENWIEITFEELLATAPALSWRIDGKEGSGNGSIGGSQASSDTISSDLLWLARAPLNDTDNIVTPQSDIVALRHVKKAGQAANMETWEDESNNVLTRVDATGTFRTIGSIYVGTNVEATFNVNAGGVVTSTATSSGDISTVCVTKDWAVTLKPDASNTNVIQAQNTSTVAVQFKGASGGTQNITRHVDSAGNTIGAVAYNGTVSITPSSGQGVVITSSGSSIVVTNSATAASATNIISVSSTGTGGRGQFTLCTDGTVSFGPLGDNAVLTKGFGISGQLSVPYKRITSSDSPFTMDGSNMKILADCSGGNITVKLPSSTKGSLSWVRKYSASNTLTVQNASGVTVFSWTGNGVGYSFTYDGSTGFEIGSAP